MENYICINGKKAELTEEQLKALGIELPKKKNPFDRVELSKGYYCITGTGKVISSYDLDDVNDRECHKIANYCTDKTLLEQRALYETLNRLLWRYSMEHDGDKIKWSDKEQKKYFISHNHALNKYSCDYRYEYQDFSTMYFISKKIAEAAIKDIIEPFMAAHPDFKW